MNLVKSLIVLLYNFKILLILKRKINLIYKNLNKKEKFQRSNINSHKNVWKAFKSSSTTKWYKVYASISGIQDPNYISEYIYYTKIEPRLNHRGLSEAYCDKNMYHKYIDHNYLPKIYLRKIQGVFYDEKYQHIASLKKLFTIVLPEAQKLVYKDALDTGGGRSIEIFNRGGNSFFNDKGQDLYEDALERLKNGDNSYIEVLIYDIFINGIKVDTEIVERPYNGEVDVSDLQQSDIDEMVLQFEGRIFDLTNAFPNPFFNFNSEFDIRDLSVLNVKPLQQILGLFNILQEFINSIIGMPLAIFGAGDLADALKIDITSPLKKLIEDIQNLT